MENLVRSEGWSLVKRRLLSKLSALESISLIPDNMEPDRFLMEVKTRSGAISIVLEWLKEIEGSAQQFQNNKESFTKIREEEYINILPDVVK